jgi:hypothetical protein
VSSEKQILFEDDNKKGKNKRNGKSKTRELKPARC